jgi:hypothetical protein
MNLSKRSVDKELFSVVYEGKYATQLNDYILLRYPK